MIPTTIRRCYSAPSGKKYLFLKPHFLMKRFFFPHISELEFLLSQRCIIELRWKIQQHPQTWTSRKRHPLQVRHSISYLLFIKRIYFSVIKKKQAKCQNLNKYRTMRQCWAVQSCQSPFFCLCTLLLWGTEVQQQFAEGGWLESSVSEPFFPRIPFVVVLWPSKQN